MIKNFINNKTYGLVRKLSGNFDSIDGVIEEFKIDSLEVLIPQGVARSVKILTKNGYINKQDRPIISQYLEKKIRACIKDERGKRPFNFEKSLKNCIIHTEVTGANYIISDSLDKNITCDKNVLRFYGIKNNKKCDYKKILSQNENLNKYIQSLKSEYLGRAPDHALQQKLWLVAKMSTKTKADQRKKADSFDLITKKLKAQVVREVYFKVLPSTLNELYEIDKSPKNNNVKTDNHLVLQEIVKKNVQKCFDKYDKKIELAFKKKVKIKGEGHVNACINEQTILIAQNLLQLKLEGMLKDLPKGVIDPKDIFSSLNNSFLKCIKDREFANTALAPIVYKRKVTACVGSATVDIFSTIADLSVKNKIFYDVVNIKKAIFKCVEELKIKILNESQNKPQRGGRRFEIDAVKNLSNAELFYKFSGIIDPQRIGTDLLKCGGFRRAIVKSFSKSILEEEGADDWLKTPGIKIVRALDLNSSDKKELSKIFDLLGGLMEVKGADGKPFRIDVKAARALFKGEGQALNNVKKDKPDIPFIKENKKLLQHILRYDREGFAVASQHFSKMVSDHVQSHTGEITFEETINLFKEGPFSGQVIKSIVSFYLEAELIKQLRGINDQKLKEKGKKGEKGEKGEGGAFIQNINLHAKLLSNKESLDRYFNSKLGKKLLENIKNILISPAGGGHGSFEDKKKKVKKMFMEYLVKDTTKGSFSEKLLGVVALGGLNKSWGKARKNSFNAFMSKNVFGLDPRFSFIWNNSKGRGINETKSGMKAVQVFRDKILKPIIDGKALNQKEKSKAEKKIQYLIQKGGKEVLN